MREAEVNSAPRHRNELHTGSSTRTLCRALAIRKVHCLDGDTLNTHQASIKATCRLRYCPSSPYGETNEQGIALSSPVHRLFHS